MFSGYSPCLAKRISSAYVIKLEITRMTTPSEIYADYPHVERVEWPQNLAEPIDWRPDHTLLSGLPEGFRVKVDRVTKSGIRFYQKVKHLQAPMIAGDTNDPDAIHALQFALDRQDELEIAIRACDDHPIEPLMLWLQERKKSHVKSMQAVVVAEEGEMYDEANKEPWEVELVSMTDTNVNTLRFIFHTVMHRIDIIPAGDSDDEFIQPIHRDVLVRPGMNQSIWYPPARPFSFWKIELSLLTGSLLGMHQAALELYHQGRVMSAGRNNLPATKQEPWPPVFAITIRAMNLTIRSIESLWTERPPNLPSEKERRLFSWLRDRKNAAVDLRFALIETHLHTDLYQKFVKIDSSGQISVLRNGEYEGWGKLMLM